MDKKNNKRSYKEVHGLLEEAMQDAFTSDEAGLFESPEIDYSFMESKDNKETSKVKDRFNRVAAIIIICLLAVNAVGYFAGTGVSYSEKGLLHRIYEGARGIFTDKDESEYVEMDETGETFTVNNWTEIDAAKKFWKGLYIPQYIPEGYLFDNLLIEKQTSGFYWGKYTFKNNEKLIQIEIIELSEAEVSSANKGYIIKLSDRKINIYKDEIEKYYVADVYFENKMIYIRANTSNIELEKIARYIDD